MKALIVDDSNINLKVTQKMLEKLGFIVDCSLSGYECIEKVKNNHYDIIFLDIMMPEMDGVETLCKLKEQENFTTPVVALTADVYDGADKDYIKKGFNAYLSKPINIEILKTIIKEFIK